MGQLAIRKLFSKYFQQGDIRCTDSARVGDKITEGIFVQGVGVLAIKKL
jgi:hypothetical protein